jgi:hypothetical protein
MKKYTTKRVLAGVLAVMTVAGYAPANVGGLLALNNIAITASAAAMQTVDITNVKGVLTSIKDSSGNAWSEMNIKNTAATVYSLTKDSTATIVSKVPLIIGDCVGQNNGAADIAIDATYHYGWDDTSKNYVKIKGDAETGTVADDYAVILQYLKNSEDEDLAAYTLAEKKQVAKASYIAADGEIFLAAKGITVSGSDSNGWTYSFKVTADVELDMVKSLLTVKNGIDKDEEWGSQSGLIKFTDKDHDEVNDLVMIGESLDDEYESGDTVGRNETIHLYSAKYFKAWTWDHNEKTRYIPYEANYVTDKESDFYGQYEIKITAKNARLTDLLVAQFDAKYTFKVATDKTSLNATGSGIDATVASIKGKYIEPTYNEAGEFVGYSEVAEDNKDLTTNSVLKNKTQVTLELSRVDDFLTTASTTGGDLGALKIEKYNGKEYKEVAATGADEYKLLDEDDEEYAYSVAKNEVANFRGGADETLKLRFTEAGKYKVTYTVYHKEDNGGVKPEDLVYVFEIGALEQLTAKNLKIEFDNVNSSAGVKDILVADKDGNPVAKLVNGVYVFEVKEGYSLNGKTVAVNAVLRTGTKKDSPTFEETYPNGTVTYTTSKKVSSTDVEQSVTCEYKDVEFGPTAQKVSVKWVVKDAAKTVYVINKNVNTIDDGFKASDLAGREEFAPNKPADVYTSIDEIGDLKKTILDGIQVVNGTKDKVTFEYVTGNDVALATDELDNHTAGLPSEVGQYSVYAMYDGEAKNVINVTITEHSLYANPTAAQLALTYGDKLFTEDDLAYVDWQGKAVSDAKVEKASIFVNRLEVIPKSQQKYVTEEDGKYWIVIEMGGVEIARQQVYKIGSTYYNAVNYDFDGDGDDDRDATQITTQNPDGEFEFLDAGNYVVTVSTGEDTNVSPEGYSLATKEYVVTVAKKQITADMIMIDPVEYDNGNSVDMGEIHGVNLSIASDSQTGNQIYLKVASGASSGTAVGANTVVVAPVTEGDLFDGDGRDNPSKLSRDNEDDLAVLRHAADNYTGTVQTKWYIVNEAADNNLNGMVWDEDETTIVSGGVIKFKIQRPANMPNIKDYGLIYEAKGKLEAPAFESVEEYVEAKTDGTYEYNSGVGSDEVQAAVARAYETLQYGNGAVNSASQSKTQANKDGGIYLGGSLPTKSTEIGLWARPYVIQEDGSIVYGEVRYIDLINEATSRLNLKTAAVKTEDEADEDTFAQESVSKNEAKKGATKDELAEKTWRNDVRSGYNLKKNAMYVYASYTLAENAKLKDDAIQAFGFVADRKGTFAAKGVGDADEQAKNYAAVKKGLKINSGFSEGRSVKNNPYMDRDEVGANVVPINATTGVWVRAFVDYGDDIVVYTDPIYIEDISTQFAQTAALIPEITGMAYDNNIRKEVMYVGSAFDGELVDDDGEEAVVSKIGVVVDTKGSFLQFQDNDNEGYNYDWDEDKVKTIWQDLIAENAASKKFTVGGKAPKDNEYGQYYATVTEERGKKDMIIPAVARPYIVYTIYGMDIVVYGEENAAFNPIEPWNN